MWIIHKIQGWLHVVNFMITRGHMKRGRKENWMKAEVTINKDLKAREVHMNI